MHQYANGVDQLADGTGQSAAGAQKLAKGGKKLASGADQLAEGADGIAGGSEGPAERQQADPGPGHEVLREEHGQQFAGGLSSTRASLKALSSATTPEEVAKVNPQLVCPSQLPAESCPAYYAGSRPDRPRRTRACRAPTAARPRAWPTRRVADWRRAPPASTRSSRVCASVPTATPGCTAYAKGMQLVRRRCRRSTPTAWASWRPGWASWPPGTDKLALGGHELAVGADQITDGADSAGRRHLAVGRPARRSSTTGSASCPRAARSWPTGPGKFADGLDKGKDQIPSYDKTLRNKLSSVVTTPVDDRRP